jgi:hypothetical protein
MTRVYWLSIGIGSRQIASQSLDSFVAAMTCGAQALQRTIPERVLIAMVFDDVVGHSCRHD